MHIELGLLQGNLKGSRKVKLLKFLMFKVLIKILKKNGGLCTGGFTALEF